MKLTELRHLDIRGEELSIENIADVEALACGIIGLANSLSSLYLTMPNYQYTIDRNNYHQLCNQLSRIRQNQDNKIILNVMIRGNEDFYVQKNKWVTLEIRKWCKCFLKNKINGQKFK